MFDNAQYLCIYHILIRIFRKNLIKFRKYLAASALQAGYTSREGSHVNVLVKRSHIISNVNYVIKSGSTSLYGSAFSILFNLSVVINPYE
jgi:predicted amidohydrolase